MKARSVLIVCGVSLAAIQGCAAPSSPVSMGDLGPAGGAPLLTLGAGDSLGREIYVKDMILAAGIPTNEGYQMTEVELLRYLDEHFGR